MLRAKPHAINRDGFMTNLPKAGGRALVVEDDAILAISMAEMLQDLGIEEVQICASTGEAMALLADFRPGLITLDVNLADRQDGWALAELALQISATPPIIIFATGSPAAVPPLVARLGHVVAKPVDPAAIRAILHKEQQGRGLIGRMRRMLGGDVA